jgi:hypothetical protein
MAMMDCRDEIHRRINRDGRQMRKPPSWSPVEQRAGRSFILCDDLLMIVDRGQIVTCYLQAQCVVGTTAHRSRGQRPSAPETINERHQQQSADAASRHHHRRSEPLVSVQTERADPRRSFHGRAHVSATHHYTPKAKRPVAPSSRPPSFAMAGVLASALLGQPS